MPPDVLRALAEEWIPFNRTLGLRALSIERGQVLFEIPFREELIGDPFRRALHGGVISMLADTAGGFAVWSMAEDPRIRVSTIDLRVDYLLPGREENLRAHGTVVRAGNTVGVADIRLFHPSDEARTIATGKGVYALRKGPAPTADQLDRLAGRSGAASVASTSPPVDPSEESPSDDEPDESL
jgi:uncharacterized protein (TIGR00369 family)